MTIWNTGKVEFDSGVGGSRVTRIGTQVAYAAAQEVKAELLQAASEALGVPTDRLAFTDGLVRNRSTGESYAWPELLQRLDRSVTGQAEFQDTSLPPVTAYVAQIAEVSVDPRDRAGQASCASLPPTTSARSSTPSATRGRSTAARCRASVTPSWRSCRSRTAA